MRILAAGEPMLLEDLGMSERNLELLNQCITQPYGIFLVVGPTGSGKTTTLHAALHAINKPDTKIWTAEDPVEITQRGLRQVQVIPKIGFDFAAAISTSSSISGSSIISAIKITGAVGFGFFALGNCVVG